VNKPKKLTQHRLKMLLPPLISPSYATGRANTLASQRADEQPNSERDQNHSVDGQHSLFNFQVATKEFLCRP